MANIYNPADGITPAISFHKSVVVDGGIVAKSASLGNSQCKLVVNDDGVYIIIPSRFDNAGNLSTVNYRKYSLGAIVEAIQELNRRTAWIEPNMTFSESLNGTDVIEDSSINPGALYNNTADLLPGLKQTAPHGNRFMLIDTTGEAVAFYQITDENKDLLTAVSDAPLMTDTSTYSSTISGIMNDDYRSKYISPRLLNVTDNSFEILLLDAVGDGEHPIFSDKYYTYTPITDNVGYKGYKASLKKGITIEDISVDVSDNTIKLIPPAPYFGNINIIDQYSITSFAGLFKGQIDNKKTYDFSDWDFSRITDMSNMFDECGTEFRIKWIHDEPMPMRPAFILVWGEPPAYVEFKNGKMTGLKDNNKDDINLADLDISADDLPNYIWKGKVDGQWIRFNGTKDATTKTFSVATLDVYTANTA